VVSGTAVDLSVRVGALQLQNPILTASGTFGYGFEFGSLTCLSRLGGLVTKGLSLEPLLGNPPPRIAEVRGGVLNSIGLQNIGVERFIRDVLPRWKESSTLLIVNILGFAFEEYVALAERLRNLPNIAALELNVSCPNVKRGGIEFGHDPELLFRLVRSVCEVATQPVWVKLSPNVPRIWELGEAAKKGGAQALTAINTVVGMAIDPWSRKPRLATGTGGLSGPAIRPIAVRAVYELSRRVEIPVVGIGGVETVDDVVEFLLAGASAVQVGTALFRNPRAAELLVAGLAQRLVDLGLQRASDLIGRVEPWG
jgi:dihydroorotate dehydrogenase (NAD+) catalytic subunit